MGLILDGSNGVSASGNITGSYILGNGAFLTGISGGGGSSYSNSNVQAYLPTYNGNILLNNLSVTTVSSSLIPLSNVTQSLGNATNQWQELWVSNNTIYIGGTPLTVNSGNLQVSGSNVLITAPNATTNVSTISATGNVTAATLISTTNINSGGNVSATGNVNATNINATNAYITGVVSANGNVRGSNLATSGNVQGTYILGNGAFLTGIAASYGDANVESLLSGGTVSTNIVTTANVNANNIVATTLTGTLQTAAQPQITSVGTLTGLTVGGAIVGNALTINGTTLLEGNVNISGNVSIPGNITQINGNSGSFFGNSEGFGALYAGIPSGYTPQPQTIIQASSDYAGFSQINLQNISSGATASADYVVTGDNGNINTNFIDMGYTSSAYAGASQTGTLGNAPSASDGYLYVQGTSNANPGGNLVIGTTTPNRNVLIIAGGGNTANVVANIGPGVVSVTGSLNLTGAIISGANIRGAVLKGTGVDVTGGNILGATVSTTGNITGAYFIGNGSQLTGLPAGYSNADVAAYLPTYSGNLGVDFVTATGNIDAGSNYILGNGALLTGLVAGYSNIDAAAYLDSGTISTNIITTANISGDYILGNGALLTGLVAGYSNADAIGLLESGTLTTDIITTGNVSANNVSGTLETATQPNITSLGTLSSLAVSGAIATNILNVTSNAQVGNLNVTGNINLTGNVTQISGNSGQFFGDTYGFGALYAGIPVGYTVEPQTVIQASGDYNDYVQVNIQNINPGAYASGDFVVTGDVGDANAFFIDMGYASSTFDGSGANALGNLVGASDGYLYVQGGSSGVQGGNLVIGTNTVGRNILFTVGGGNTVNQVANMSASLFSVTGAIIATDNIRGVDLIADGNISAIGNITGTYFSGNGAGLANIQYGNIDNAYGNADVAAYLATSNAAITGSSISVSGNVTATDISGTLTTASQPNITDVGTLLGLNVNGAISASGNVTGALFIGDGGGLGNIQYANIAGAYGDSNVTSLLAGGTVSTNITTTANVSGGNIISTGVISTTGSIVSSGNLRSGNVNSVNSLTGTGLNISTGTATLGNITNANGNLVGNIGSSSNYFNTVFAQATSAVYADLAEKYTADALYEPGTVVSFGGTEEVTISELASDSKVAGVISANPSYLMNATLESEYVAVVALTGRVPCKVTGTIQKGDLIVSAGNGVATASASPSIGTVIGKALENFNGESGVIEVVVGRI